jgi:hypothetical protein
MSAPEPTYTLSPENCLPSPKCFTCPDRTLCPDCQTYLRTHAPSPLKIEEIPAPTTQAAETGVPSAIFSPFLLGKGAGGIGQSIYPATLSHGECPVRSPFPPLPFLHPRPPTSHPPIVPNCFHQTIPSSAPLRG